MRPVPVTGLFFYGGRFTRRGRRPILTDMNARSQDPGKPLRHLGRSLAISLGLCIIFFVILRPPARVVEEDGVGRGLGRADSAAVVADSLPQDSVRGRQ